MISRLEELMGKQYTRYVQYNAKYTVHPSFSHFR